MELLVGEVAWLPDGKARWVAVPLVIRLGHITEIVKLLARVVLMYVLAVALEVISAVLNTPEPTLQSVMAYLRKVEEDVHVVLIEGDTNFVAQTIAGVISSADIVISTAGNSAQVEHLYNSTSRRLV